MTHQYLKSTINLQGRKALVTGVSRKIGIGFSIAKHLLKAGAEVFIQSWTKHDAAQAWGADPEGISAIIDELKQIGPRVEHAEVDFSDPAAPASLIAKVYERWGSLDCLVINHAHSSSNCLEELTAQSIDFSMAVNLRAALLLSKEFSLRHDDSRPGGRIILFTSGQHLEPMPGEMDYVASKGAIHQITLSLSDHLIPRGITVNTINPGATDTGYADEATYNIVKEHNPQKRWGTPDDAARLVIWLCSDEGRWMTGQIFNSNGGGY